MARLRSGLGGGFGRLGRRLRQHDLTTRLLDRRDGALRRAGDFDGDLGLQFARSQQANAVPYLAQEARLAQNLTVDRLRRVEPAGVDRGLQLAKVHDHERAAEDVVETPFGHAHVERHLAALEALDVHAGARRLALAAATAGLALAGPNAAADPHAGLAGAGVVREL